MTEALVEEAKKQPFKRVFIPLLLLLIILLGFYFRIYHVDYPVVGYHNWKETHYLTEARNFAREGFFSAGMFIPTYNYPKIDDDVSGAHADSFPTTSLIVGALFRLFGDSLILARFVNILFSLATILVLYLFTKELTNREDISLTSAVLFAFNPMYTFFGRKMDIINLALLLMLLGGYYYLKWLKNISFKNTLLFSVFLTFSFLTKYDFFIIFLPILFTFPYKQFKSKEFFNLNKKIYNCFLIFLLIPIWLVYTKLVSNNLNKEPFALAFDFNSVFTKEWYSSIWMYISDSITHLGFVYAMLGLLIILLFLKKRTNRFLLYFIYLSPIWIFIASGYLKGHIFHQYPIMPLIIILISYFFVFVATNIQKFVKFKYLKIIIIFILLISVYLPSMGARERMFNTQFIGLDVAGEFIKQHSSSDERLVFPSHQSYGVLWHADRKGFGSGWRTLENFKYAESVGVKWVFVYQWGMDLFQDEELWGYISKNYSLRQIGFVSGGQTEIVPIYFLLSKGGSFDMDELNNLTQGKEINHQEYELTNDKITMGYIDL